MYSPARADEAQATTEVSDASGPTYCPPIDCTPNEAVAVIDGKEQLGPKWMSGSQWWLVKESRIAEPSTSWLAHPAAGHQDAVHPGVHHGGREAEQHLRRGDECDLLVARG